eukprot:364818-Chlamydomonas_euryale.AAC.11
MHCRIDPWRLYIAAGVREHAGSLARLVDASLDMGRGGRKGDSRNNRRAPHTGRNLAGAVRHSQRGYTLTKKKRYAALSSQTCETARLRPGKRLSEEAELQPKPQCEPAHLASTQVTAAGLQVTRILGCSAQPSHALTPPMNTCNFGSHAH